MQNELSKKGDSKKGKKTGDGQQEKEVFCQRRGWSAIEVEVERYQCAIFVPGLVRVCLRSIN